MCIKTHVVVKVTGGGVFTKLCGCCFVCTVSVSHHAGESGET